jgi:hypothetical protein
VTASITGTKRDFGQRGSGAFAVSAPAWQLGCVIQLHGDGARQFNNTATAYAGTVHFTSSDGAATLPANSTLASGTGSFSATLNTSGSQTIRSDRHGHGFDHRHEDSIAVGCSPATHFSVTAPASATAGVSFSFTVTALTAANTTATGYSGAVHFTSSDALGVLPANTTLVKHGHVLGDAQTAGNQTITATDTITASITGTSGTIAVGSGPATHFTVNAPAVANTGVAFSFTITAQDAFNNTATAYGGTVHFTSSDGAAVLPANTTLVAGTKTVSATLNTVGGQTITGRTP